VIKGHKKIEKGNKSNGKENVDSPPDQTKLGDGDSLVNESSTHSFNREYNPSM
jgi:hypothetical protein